MSGLSRGHSYPRSTANTDVNFILQAGIYIYQLCDWYSSSICMCLGGCLEFVAVAWYYGMYQVIHYPCN